MLSKLKMFLKSHRNNFFVRFLYKIKNCRDAILGFFKDLSSRKRLKKLQKKFSYISKERKLNGKINVVFLVANPNTWNKLKPLFDEMNQKERINTFILCCPEPNKQDTSTTYNYFVSNGYKCIDARTGDGFDGETKKAGEWFDLKQLNPDYVFYSEPYNHYLPKIYRSNAVSKYAKVCLTIYGIMLSKDFIKMVHHQFYRDVYCYYASNVDDCEININYYKKNHKMGIQKTKYLGYMAFSDIVNAEKKESKSFEFSKNEQRTMWTPRWTLDESLESGSNFFKYKDVLFKYAEENPDFDILYRPHPMALDNFIKTGKMSVEEVNEFKQKCSDMPNVSLDDQKEYSASFWKTNFLVTDSSSIIVEYFVTGKPIIFCDTLSNCTDYLPYFRKLLESCYIISNEQELIQKINDLRAGKDELKDLRKQYFTEFFGDDLLSIAGKIADDVIDDFSK